MAEKKQDTFVDKYLPNFMDAFQKKAEISLQKSLEPSGKVCKFVGGRAEQKWIPVTERLPEDSSGVILCTRSRIVGVGFYDKDTRNWVQHYSGGGICVEVTHWMPLPEPPKEVE